MFRQDGRLVAYPSQNNLIPTGNKQQANPQLTQKQILQQKQMLMQSGPSKSSGPIRSRPNITQPMLTKAQLAQQQQLAFQHRAACANAALSKYTPNVQVCDVRCKSKSSDDVRKSVSTGTEDLDRSALTAQNTSHNARRLMPLHPLPSSKTTTTMQTSGPGKISGYQSDHGLTRRMNMQTTGTNTTCNVPNCNLAHRSKIDAFSQNAYPRPTSVPNWNFGTSEDSADVDVRSRPFRSETGRRRSLERTACVDYTDQSPPSDTYMLENLKKMFHQQQTQQKQQQQNGLQNKLSGLKQGQHTPTPTSTSGEDYNETAIALALANSVKQGRKAAIQQNLNALLGNKLANKLLLNNIQQLSKQNSSEQVPPSSTTITPGSLPKQQPQPQSTIQSQQTGTSSPTIKALQEYERLENNLRNMLARGSSTELENFSLNTLETLVSKSLENVVSLMNEVQNELDAIQLEEQQYRAEQETSQNQKLLTNQQQQAQTAKDIFSQQFNQDLKGDKHYWSRSYSLPRNKQGLSSSLNINKPQSVTGISPSQRFGNLASTNASSSLGFGLNMAGLLSGTGSNDLFKEMKKRSTSSTPFLDAISMDNLAYLTGGWNAGQASFETQDSRVNLTWSEVGLLFII